MGWADEHPEEWARRRAEDDAYLLRHCEQDHAGVVPEWSALAAGKRALMHHAIPHARLGHTHMPTVTL